MILVDSNLLIYATCSDFRQHEAARRWLEDCLAEPARVGFPWQSLLAFLRVTTNPRVFVQPMSPEAAWGRVIEWISLPNVWIPAPGERHAEILGGLISAVGVLGNLVGDAHLAAIAIEHGLTVYSCDSDFARFPSLRFENPLAT